MESEVREPLQHPQDESFEQMLELAERLREANGGFLDDSAIQAVSEATGTPVEYVRLAAKIRTEKRTSFVARLHGQWSALEPQVRRHVVSGGSATMCALFAAGGQRANDMAAAASLLTNPHLKPDEIPPSFAGNILDIVALVWLTAGLYNACVARDSRTGAMVGAIFSASLFAAYELFGFVLRLSPQESPSAMLIVPAILMGALAGMFLQKVTDKYRNTLGLRDPAKERQDLLRQLTELQERLNSDQQEVTFLSVDIVGSTKMKEKADAFAVEFTFNEYHLFVERITKKHKGRVHSTAGDGVTCAFEDPRQAFMAAKNIAAELIELNMFRNKIGAPIQVRQGIHTGTVMTPDQDDITSVNFAHVIDIAAHLQKMTPTGTVVISDASAMYLGGPTAIGTERVNASGVEGTIWDAKTPAAPREPSKGGPPPLPKLV